MNHPRDPQALRAFSYNPTAAEVACFASGSDDLDGYSVRTADVLTAARAAGALKAGRVDKLSVSTVAHVAQGIARERMLRERETRAVVNTAWAAVDPSVAREAYHG